MNEYLSAYTGPTPEMTSEQIKSAMAKVALMQEVLDITNADHIVLWLEANIKDSALAWLACRIIEAHEAVLTAREASARAEGRREGIEEAAKVAERAMFNEYGRPQPVLVARLRALAEKQP